MAKRTHNTLINIGTVISLLSLILCSTISVGAEVQQGKKIAWISDQTTIDAAKLKGKPGMLYFYAGLRTTSSIGLRETDVIDEKMENVKIGLPQDTLDNKDVIELSRKFSCFEFNLDKSKELIARFFIDIYPVVIFTDLWGNEISRCIGEFTAEELIPFMEIFPEDYTDVLSWKRTLNKDSKNYEALLGLGAFYRNLEAWSMSNEYYKSALKTNFVRKNEELMEETFLFIGLNELKMRNFKEAQWQFEDCLERVRDAKDRDKAMLGLIFAQLGQGKISGAEKNLKRMKSLFPGSPAIEQAERYIQSVKGIKQ